MMKTYWVLAAIFFLCHLFRPEACQHLWINVVWGHKADWLLEIVIIYIFLILIFELYKTQLYTQTWSFKRLVHSTILQWCCLAFSNNSGTRIFGPLSPLAYSQHIFFKMIMYPSVPMAYFSPKCSCISFSQWHIPTHLEKVAREICTLVPRGGWIAFLRDYWLLTHIFY